MTGTDGTNQEREEAYIHSRHVWLMAFSVGAIVANIYYIQPLLTLVASAFHVSAATIGTVAMASQLGTALGMLVFVPMGDNTERRSLIVKLLLAAALCLGAMATAENFWWLVVASSGVGLTASTVHVIVPYAAHLAKPQERGATIGKVLSGMLVGILLARAASGLLGAWFGWRTVYYGAAALMLFTAAVFYRQLPKNGPLVDISWVALIRSAWELAYKLPALRESAAIGSLLFSSFSAFWTTLVFFLWTPPYHYGSAMAGAFGLVGVTGALAAPVAGRLADKHGPRRNILLALCTTLLSFLVLYRFGRNLAGLITGIILLDFGVQAGHVSNQARIYALAPDARSRLNMVYMTCYFIAGSMGSFAGAFLWERLGWFGVCSYGSVLVLAGLSIHVLNRPRAHLGKI